MTEIYNAARQYFESKIDDGVYIRFDKPQPPVIEINKYSEAYQGKPERGQKLFYYGFNGQQIVQTVNQIFLEVVGSTYHWEYIGSPDDGPLLFQARLDY